MAERPLDHVGERQRRGRARYAARGSVMDAGARRLLGAGDAALDRGRVDLLDERLLAGPPRGPAVCVGRTTDGSVLAAAMGVVAHGDLLATIARTARSCVAALVSRELRAPKSRIAAPPGAAVRSVAVHGSKSGAAAGIRVVSSRHCGLNANTLLSPATTMRPLTAIGEVNRRTPANVLVPPPNTTAPVAT